MFCQSYNLHSPPKPTNCQKTNVQMKTNKQLLKKNFQVLKVGDI